MKKFVITLLAALSLQMTAFAQSDKFVSAMKSNLVLFDSAKSVEDFQKLANTFERIGDAEKTQWLPYYYAGLSLTMAGWMEQMKDKDGNSGRINALGDKADALAAGNSDKAEILTLRNMAATQQMIVDPQSRWMTYGQTASQALDKAMKLDPNNPRLYYLQGMSLFGTPEQFGGGKDKAKPVFEKAVQLYKEAKPKELYPRWGQQQAEAMIAQCQ